MKVKSKRSNDYLKKYSKAILGWTLSEVTLDGMLKHKIKRLQQNFNTDSHREPRETREHRDTRDVREAMEPRDVVYSPREAYNAINQDLREPRGTRGPQNVRGVQDARDARERS